MSDQKIVKTINRGWLKRQVAAGNVEAKCNHHLTDDYAYDNANRFGVTGWMQARIRHPVFGSYVNEFGYTRERCVDSDFVEGQMNFNETDFEGKCGGAHQYEDGTIHFYIHSNASYDLRIARR
jgi:hypothetical protein